MSVIGYFNFKANMSFQLITTNLSYFIIVHLVFMKLCWVILGWPLSLYQFSVHTRTHVHYININKQTIKQSRKHPMFPCVRGNIVIVQALRNASYNSKSQGEHL